MENIKQIDEAYAKYDADPRVRGPRDIEAFRDAVTPLLQRRVIYHPDQSSLNLAFGVSSERAVTLSEAAFTAVDQGTHVGQIIADTAKRADITDGEFAALIFMLGFNAGKGSVTT